MRNSESLKKNRVRSIYIEGNTAIEIEEEKPARVRREAVIRRQREEGLRAHRARKRELTRKTALAATGCVLVSSALVLLLSSVITYNTLTSEVQSLTNELNTLTMQNDSIEYDIDSSVDLNEIIDTATNELGMVQSSASQIVTYSDSKSEYIDQVAGIPTE